MSKLLKYCKELGYECKEVGESILLVENFLTDEEIVSVRNQIEASKESDWVGHYMRGIIENAKKKYGRDDVDNLIKEGVVEVTGHWIDKNLALNWEISEPISKRVTDLFKCEPDVHFDGIGTIQRQYSGAPLIEHVDNHTDPGIVYAVILYINDDYVDGELFFSKLGLEIKPPAKSLLIFPSGEKYWHGVKPPGDGPVRYVLPSFARIAK
jgi:hypothetical protein